jgi:putative glutamine amidotransferase
MRGGPRIAVTTTQWPGGSHGLLRAQVDVTYLHAVEAAGGVPLLLTPGHAPGSLEAILDLSHGLLLTGGEDVEPHRYGQDPHPALGEVNPPRDEMELAATRSALDRGMPVLAVCRGIQLLNVAMGGTLWQDIPAQLGGDLLHEQDGGVDDRPHRARVEPGSLLAAVVGMHQLSINSFHHQAIRDLAPGLRVTAWAPDGVVEGVEGTAHPWLVGVQWHPERGEAHGPAGNPHDPDRRLFAAFVEAAARGAGG